MAVIAILDPRHHCRPAGVCQLTRTVIGDGIDLVASTFTRNRWPPRAGNHAPAPLGISKSTRGAPGRTAVEAAAGPAATVAASSLPADVKNTSAPSSRQRGDAPPS